MAGHPAAAAGDSGKPAPYVLIHKDGYRIDAMEKPVREGGQVKIRLAPQGLLTILPESDIDWAATEKYNAQFKAPAPPPPPPTEPSEETANGEAPVIRKTIVGSRLGAKMAAANAAGDGEAAEGGQTGAAKPAAGAAADPALVAARRQAIAREIDNVRKTHETALANKSRLEAQIAELQQRVANEPPPGGIQKYESPFRKSLAEAQASLASVNAQIQTLESRLGELQYEASQAAANAADAAERQTEKTE